MMFSCVVIFTSILYQISSGAPHIYKMASKSGMSDKRINPDKIEAAYSKTVEKKGNCIISCTIKILSPLEGESKMSSHCRSIQNQTRFIWWITVWISRLWQNGVNIHSAFVAPIWSTVEWLQQKIIGSCRVPGCQVPFQYLLKLYRVVQKYPK